MEKYSVMIKRAVLSLLVILISFPLFAETPNTVSLRFGKQEGGMRVVLQSDDDFVKNATTVTSPSQIEVIFPSIFVVTKPTTFPYEVRQEERRLFISLKEQNVTDIKVSRLSGPARLVFDLNLKTVPGQSSKTPGQPVQKAPQPARKDQPVPAQSASGSQNAQPQQHRPRVVVIDPGHGGYDYGILSKQASEKDTDLVLAKSLANALTRKGLTVYLTRKADQYVPIGDRIRFSNGKAAAIFISIHSSSSNHFALYTSDVEDLNIDAAVRPYNVASQQRNHIEESRTLAKSLAIAIGKEFTGTEVVMRELPVPLLNGLQAPAVLIEYPSVAQVRYDQKMQDRFVDSILKGIAANEQ